MRYDKRDPDPQVIKLTRAGHYLLRQVRDPKLGTTHRQQEAISDALDILWACKRQIKAEMSAKRSEEWQAKKVVFGERAQ